MRRWFGRKIAQTQIVLISEHSFDGRGLLEKKRPMRTIGVKHTDLFYHGQVIGNEIIKVLIEQLLLVIQTFHIDDFYA